MTPPLIKHSSRPPEAPPAQDNRKAFGFAVAVHALLVLVLVVTMSFGIVTLAHERFVADLKMEHELRIRIQNQLAEAERAAIVGRMVGGVAHFFNNQMAVIQLACPLLQDEVSPSNTGVASLVDAIDKASKRAAIITSRLLQYAQSKMSLS